MKELPATLILRPFNFETLATQVYHFASDERIEASALGALFIVDPAAVAKPDPKWVGSDGANNP